MDCSSQGITECQPLLRQIQPQPWIAYAARMLWADHACAPELPSDRTSDQLCSTVTVATFWSRAVDRFGPCLWPSSGQGPGKGRPLLQLDVVRSRPCSGPADTQNNLSSTSEILEKTTATQPKSLRLPGRIFKHLLNEARRPGCCRACQHYLLSSLLLAQAAEALSCSPSVFAAPTSPRTASPVDPLGEPLQLPQRDDSAAVTLPCPLRTPRPVASCRLPWPSA